MSMEFEVGKTYETAVRNFYSDCGLVEVGQRFTCHYVGGAGTLGVETLHMVV